MPHAQHLSGNNPANDPDLKPVKNRSTFKPNRSLYQTMLFGLNTPHFAMECVEGDKISVRVGTDLDTFSLKAPLMTPVKMHKDYFYVPLRAILPHNAELLITNPLSGDDVVAHNVNCGMTYQFLADCVGDMLSRIDSNLTAIDITNPTYTDPYDKMAVLLDTLIVACSFGDLFLSSNSLLNVLGNGNDWVKFGDTVSKGPITWDMFVDAIADKVKFGCRSFKVDTISPKASTGTVTTDLTGVEVFTSLAPDRQGYSGWSLRYFLEQLRQGLIVSKIYGITLNGGSGVAPVGLGANNVFYEEFTDDFGIQYANSYVMVSDYTNMPQDPRFVNLSRLVAYQLASAQFYTSDTVDYIYNCNLWHNNMLSLASMSQHTGSLGYDMRYILNGTGIQYDSCSRVVVDQMLDNVGYNAFAWSMTGTGASVALALTNPVMKDMCAWMYCVNLFGYTRSLKFRDYFVGSKVRPLAVGSTQVAVSGGYVDVVDVTKNIQVQRFLNQVNRVGRTFKEYVQGIFGVTPMRDAHEVIFLGHTTDNIGAEETSNTGEAQLTLSQSTTSKLRKDSSQFAFEGSFSDPGILIGITNFDVARPYTNTVDRAFFHEDRFDMFNPFLQQIGDQAVYGAELDNIAPMATVDFGYQLRYSEYKQSHDRAVGGFVGFLPGYAFLNNRAVFGTFAGGIFTVPSISPDFIRSRSCEFDPFYVSLTHCSLAGYFHFICRQDINVTANRPMESAPSIL